MNPTGQRQTSFAEVAFHEAAARKVRLNLLIKPVREDDQRQLASRFLAMADRSHAVLATPTKPNGDKVFLPLGWQLGMGFAVGNLFIQARASVEAHTQHPVYPGRKVDALVIRCPQKVTSITRRQEVRYDVDDPHLTSASVWLEQELLEGLHEIHREGRVLNWSESGFGIHLPAPVPFEPGAAVVLRVEGLRGTGCTFYRGAFRHCSAHHGGGFLIGFGEVSEITPGQCYPIMETLSRPAT